MEFIHLLNVSAVVWINNSDGYWSHIPRTGGFEAYSPTGEIKAFTTYERANEWRLSEVRAAYQYATELVPSWDIDGTFAGYRRRGIGAFI